MKRLPFLSLCVGVLAGGCGGGGGASGGPPVVPATTMRANVVGDAWSYQVTADLPVMGDGSGTLSETLTSDTYNGSPSIRDTQTFNLTYPSQVVTISTFSESSPAKGLEAVVSGTGLVAVTSETFHSPTQFSLNTSASGVLTLSDGTKVTTTYKVVAKDRVTVPAGTFDCWVVEEQQNHADGTTDTFTLDVAPETGNWIKATAHTVYSGGQVFNWQAELFAMTTPP